MKFDGAYEKPRYKLWQATETLYIWFQVNGPDVCWRRKKEFHSGKG